MKFKKILLSLLICLSCFVQAKNITISRLTCEMQEGLVVVEGSPRLGWVMESPENGTRQSAYEIDIREAFTGRSVWNSGKVYSSQSQLVSTKGADIRPDNSFNYSWRIQVGKHIHFRVHCGIRTAYQQQYRCHQHQYAVLKREMYYLV